MINFNKKIQAQFAIMAATGKLFRVELSGQQIWDIYLTSFLDGQDPTFRDPSSTSHTCNHCNNFIRRYGNVVALDESLNIITMFDFEGEDNFKGVAEAMSAAIKVSTIKDVFFETYQMLCELKYEECSDTKQSFRLGVEKNVKRYTKEEAEVFKTLDDQYIVKPNERFTFNHMHINLPANFVSMNAAKSLETILNDFRSAQVSFSKGMAEIPADTLELVQDLIMQDSLINGKTYLDKVQIFLAYKKEYDLIEPAKRDNWCWITAYRLPIATFRAHLIGQLCMELAEGMELNKACKNWNTREDPANKMNPTAPITAKQKSGAEKYIVENGYEESFTRRFATLDDIKVSEIKHINTPNKVAKNASIFDAVKPSVSSRHKRSEFKGVEEISIDKFMSDILPGCSSVEAFFTNSHKGNLVSLTTSIKEDCKPIFKWSNPYSWTFNGNLAGKSEIKEAVKNAGGEVAGVLNFRLAWNHGDGTDRSDMDIWAREPNGNQIGYSTPYRKDVSSPRRSPMSGQLDVDNRTPNGKLAVENIAWTDFDKMKPGKYEIWINQYNASASRGFKVEIEFGDDMYSYDYPNPVTSRANVKIAAVTLNSSGSFTIEHYLPVSEGDSATSEIYGIETNNFHKVNLVCNSPNHWGENNEGNKFYMFMIENCKAPGSIRSFHNENLLPELLTHHKHVMNVLGSVHQAPAADKQLSGLGFNATVRDELIVRLGGSFKRVVKIKF